MIVNNSLMIIYLYATTNTIKVDVLIR